MKTTLQNNNYDTMLEASDWRFSAAIVGLMQYLDYYNLDYNCGYSVNGSTVVCGTTSVGSIHHYPPHIF